MSAACVDGWIATGYLFSETPLREFVLTGVSIVLVEPAVSLSLALVNNTQYTIEHAQTCILLHRCRLPGRRKILNLL